MDWEYLRVASYGESFVGFTPYQGTCKRYKYNNHANALGIYLIGIVTRRSGMAEILNVSESFLLILVIRFILIDNYLTVDLTYDIA